MIHEKKPAPYDESIMSKFTTTKQHGGDSNQIWFKKDPQWSSLSLVFSFQIFESHPRLKAIKHSRNSHLITSAISRHISASNLSNKDLPTLFSQNNLCLTDRQIWDSTYPEQYDGLNDAPCWDIITEIELQKIQHKYKGVIPSMVISIIKKDEFGNPKLAKYRIVALENTGPVN